MNGGLWTADGEVKSMLWLQSGSRHWVAIAGPGFGAGRPTDRVEA